MHTTYFQEFILWIRVTFNPRYWSQLYRTSREWDKKLRGRMSANYKFKNIHTGCRISLGKVEVWVANYPYAFGYNPDAIPTRLPSRRTRLLLKQFLKEHALNLETN